MHFRAATKVGLAVLTSLATFALISFLLLGRGFRSSKYPLDVYFKDTQNLTPGAEVRMAGVVVGTVDRIDLGKDYRAHLHLLIDKHDSIPQGSRFIVTAGGLIGEKYVSIEPNEQQNAMISPHAVVPGTDQVEIEDLMAQANKLAASSGKVIDEAQGTLHDTRMMIQAVSDKIQDPALQKEIMASLRNVEAASRNIQTATAHADRMSSTLETAARGATPRIDSTLASFEKSAHNVQDLTDAVNGILAGKNVKTDLGDTLHNIRLATDQLPAVTANLKKTTADLQRFTSDTQTTTDLKETLANVRETTEQAKEATIAINQAVQRLTGHHGEPKTGTGTSESEARKNPIEPQGSATMVENLDPGHFRLDLNGVYPIGSDQFLFGGLYGLGEDNRLNLQLGQSLGGGWTSRYGIYSGRLGIGLDRGLGDSDGWNLNLYDPNHLKADLYARKRLKKDTSLVIGVDRIFDGPTPTVGVQIRH